MPVKVRPGATAYFTSTPSVPAGSDDFDNGLPASTGCVVNCVSAYGVISSFFSGWVKARPVSSPNDETKPLALRGRSGHVDASSARARMRPTAKPNVEVEAGLKRSCENGIRNSARQPLGVRDTAASHTASQLRSLFESLNQ